MRIIKNADLSVSGTFLNPTEKLQVRIELKDENGKIIQLNNESMIVKNDSVFSINNKILNPKKWDAEHPNLYQLKISLIEKGEVVWHQIKKIGFRELTIKGNKLLVNGIPVKLRGACRHDMHPLLGRVSTPEYELKDVQLAKEANMNFIRTSHYPASENFLKLCDEYGIYVEDESAVCFVNNHRMKGYGAYRNIQDDPSFKNRFLSQVREMVRAHRNHPSVVIWSLGNESAYGTNIEHSYHWIKEADTTRPIMFSWPGSIPEGTIKPYDILSMHYPAYNGELKQQGFKVKDFEYIEEMPVLFDEWAHIACYIRPTIVKDPNIRDYWGKGLDSMWAKTYRSDGGLGGAIWGMVDESFMLPNDLQGFDNWWGYQKDNTVFPYKGHTIGYGDWGFVDVWRRKKPEFWSVKKAYSPIKILHLNIENTGQDTIEIPILNRFNHTNLNEIDIVCAVGNSKVSLPSLNVKPGAIGKIRIPKKMVNPEKHTKISLSFYHRNKKLIDKYQVRLSDEVRQKEITKNIPGAHRVEENPNRLIIKTPNFQYTFDKTKGQFENVQKGIQKMSLKGPFPIIYTRGKSVGYLVYELNSYGNNYQAKNVSYKNVADKTLIHINGQSNDIIIDYQIEIENGGKVSVKYNYENIPEEYINEVGMKFTFQDEFDAVKWERQGYWSYYPKDHISANSGTAGLYPASLKNYREEPAKKWGFDTKMFYYEGTGNETSDQLTQLVKASKENVYHYSLHSKKVKRFEVLGEGKIACRIDKEGTQINLNVMDVLDYPDLEWGNFQKNILPKEKLSGSVHFKIY